MEKTQGEFIPDKISTNKIQIENGEICVQEYCTEKNTLLENKMRK